MYELIRYINRPRNETSINAVLHNSSCVCIFINNALKKSNSYSHTTIAEHYRNFDGCRSLSKFSVRWNGIQWNAPIYRHNFEKNTVFTQISYAIYNAVADFQCCIQQQQRTDCCEWNKFLACNLNGYTNRFPLGIFVLPPVSTIKRILKLLSHWKCVLVAE